MILSQASAQVLEVLPSLPPSPTRKYEGAQKTAAIRAAVQKSLDSWRPGHIDFPEQHAAVDLNRSDTKSFGETHANELSAIDHDSTAPRPSTPKPSGGITLHDRPVPAPAPVSTPSDTTSLKLATSPPVSSLPLQTESLNLAPTPLPNPTITPTDTTAISHISGSDPIDHPAKLPQVTPTVAETGVPKSAGPDGPGPASGSLSETKADHGIPAGYPGNAIGSIPKPYESAEDEKRRLEREEREKLLASGSNTNPAPGSGKPDETEEELPPYKEF